MNREGFGKFLDENINWQMRKERKMAVMQHEKQQNEKKIYTHKPEIDNNSKQIARSTLKETTVFERLGSQPSKKTLVKRGKAIE